MKRKNSLKRGVFSHKNDYGHVLILAGSPRMCGAAFLATRAALLCGAGKVTLGLPRRIHPLLARRLTEAMTLPLKETRKGSLDAAAAPGILRFARHATAVAVGPGLTTHLSTARLVRRILPRLDCPVVVDADGLNSLAGNPGLLKRARKSAVITPHAGEFRHLTGVRVPKSPGSRKRIAKKFAKDYHCVLVLKGHHTLVAEPGGRVYVNRTGNPGMATGGTGDVLTGMIASFAAQGFDPYFASCLAVYAHGRSGDETARKKGHAALLAGDLLTALPSVLKRIEGTASLRRLLKI